MLVFCTFVTFRNLEKKGRYILDTYFYTCVQTIWLNKKSSSMCVFLTSFSVEEESEEELVA